MTRAPDYIEPLIAYRAWRLRKGRLWSLANDTIWTPGRPLVAKCVMCRCGQYYELLDRINGTQMTFRETDGVPHKWCSCGVYAKKDLDDLIDYVRTFGLIGMWVVGRVKLTGKVIPGSIGYRAERCEIDAILETELTRSVIRRQRHRRIAKRYGVPYVRQRDLVSR